VKKLGHILKALRISQWAKNLLLFVSLMMAHQIGNTKLLVDAAVAFICFCFFASTGYILNDLIDIESDRLHPTKAQRPFASGALSVSIGIALIVTLIIAGLLPAIIFLPRGFTYMLVGYLLLSIVYSAYFKKMLLIDVILLPACRNLKTRWCWALLPRQRRRRVVLMRPFTGRKKRWN